MDTKFEFPEGRGERIVYVRAVAVADLPEDVRTQGQGRETIYALHDAADGERLALVADRRMAFFLARQNDMAPVNVH